MTLTQNELLNCGETWYEIKYYSYREGAICMYKMTSGEYEEFAEEYHKNEALMKRNRINSVMEYIKTVLSLNS